MKRQHYIIALCIFAVTLALAVGIAAAQGGTPPTPTSDAPRGPDAPQGTQAYLTFQGRLTTAGGSPVITPVQATFRIYTNTNPAVAPSAIWTSALRTITPANGLFTVYLGGGSDPNLGDSVVARAAAIGIQIAPDPEMTPRQPLNSVVGNGAYRGVYGGSPAGSGVVGSSSSGTGVVGTSSSGVGVSGSSTSVVGVVGSSTGGIGVSGSSTSVVGVFGSSTSGYGVYASSTSGDGVGGYSTNGVGVVGSSGSNKGVFGVSSSDYGVYGHSDNSYGVYGASGSTYGVYGNSDSSIGVFGNSGSNVGVYGASGSSTGVVGNSTSGMAGFFSGGAACCDAGVRVINGGSAVGLWASTTGANAGIFGQGASGVGVLGRLGSGVTTGYAGQFLGNVQVTGNLSKGGGSFKIDHPLDPANQYLYHSFVESPDMMNIYNGNVTTDANGEAVIQLPDWFEALNKDFRYQLTPIGQFAQAMVLKEIADNQFTIKTDKPNVKVSWQVTGIRHDPYANAYRIPVEEEKPTTERGRYLHPELYGQPESQGIEAMLRVQAVRATQPISETERRP